MKLIDKDALVAEIERKIEAHKETLKNCDSSISEMVLKSSMSAYQNLLHFLGTIDTKEMQEEAVSNDFEEAAREWLKPKLDKSYINYGESKMMELTHFDGYAMLDATEFGAQWQKEQLMKNAVEAVIHPYDAEVWVDKDLLSIYDDCQRVKLIIIKEE